MSYFIAENSIVEEDVSIGDETKIWYLTHIRKGAKIGKNCNIGDGCFIDTGVIVGNDCRIANGVKLYKGVVVKDRVFIGPDVVFTNVRKPSIKKRAKKFLDTIVDDDVSIEGKATIVGGVRIGKGSIIGAGSVVISNLPEEIFAVGNPAKIIKKINGENN